MNGEVPSVPIITLSGVSSLVDLLPEIQLPSPLPQTLSNKSLLFHPRVAEEARRLLYTNDNNLVPQLVQCLSQTSSRQINLKDQYPEADLVDAHSAPGLLAGILHTQPDVFNGKYDHTVDWTQHQAQHQLPNQTHADTNQHTPPQQQLYPTLNMNMNNTGGVGVSHIPTHQHLHPQSLQTQRPQLQQQHSLRTLPSHLSHLPQMEIGTNAQSPQILHNNDIDNNRQVKQPQHPIQFPHQQLQQGNVQVNNVSIPNNTASLHHSHGSSQIHNDVQPSVDTNLNLQHSSKSSHVNPVQQHQQHVQQSSAHLTHTSLKQNVVDWNQVHADASKPQNYGVNSIVTGAQHPSIPSNLSQVQQQIQPTPVVQKNNTAASPTKKNSCDFNRSVNVPSTFVATTHSQNNSNTSSSIDSSHTGQNRMEIPRKLALDDIVNALLAPKIQNPPTAQPQPQVSTASQPVQAAPPPLGVGSTPKFNPVLNASSAVIQNSMNLKLQIPRINVDESKAAISKIQQPAATSPKPTEEKAQTGSVRRQNTVEAKSEVSESKDKRRRSSTVSLGDDGDRRSSIGSSDLDSDGMPKAKIRRVERMLVPVLEKLSSGATIKKGSGPSNSTLDGTTYHRFLKTMGVVLENNDPDFEREMDLEDDGQVPSELLIPKHQLSDLCAEAAKLKALGCMEAIPSDKMVELLKLLELNIREGCKVTPLADSDETEEESRLWVELTLESIQRGVIASLTALHILTSQNMPKKVYIEDLIDRIVRFTKFQLQNTVYPTFDPVYRIDPRGKDAFSSGKRKRAHAREVREKNMISFYHKIHEVVGLLSELINVQVLTDTTVLHLSSLGVSPFFVENVSELQLAALKLVTGIFTRYDKHRRLLLDDILASIARLPSSKRSLRTFKLSSSSEDCIQMLTALVLQLIQCVSYLPEKLGSTKVKGHLKEVETETKTSNADRDVIICNKFETAVGIAGIFLTVFLNKCGSKSEDCDYRILFENFVQDLLSTVNKPEWPAAELLLSLLGTILVKNLGNKSLDVSMRVSSLEYLGVAAARLRKDAVSARVKMDTIDRLIADIRSEEEEYSDLKNSDYPPDSIEAEEEKIEFVQRLLLDYLAVQGQEDPALLHSRHFLIASWWKSAHSDITKAITGTTITPRKKPPKPQRKKKKKAQSSDDETSEDEDDCVEIVDKEDEKNTKILEMTEKRKKFLLTKIRPFSDPLGSRKTQVLQSYVDYASAQLMTRYLASKRPFSASFDFFLTRILSVSSEQTVAIRTKSLRCLTMVVEADANVLARTDMQMWVQNSFLDQSTAVREAAVDLVGKYVLSCHDLIDKYYDMLSLRILDTGVSVRKRVIKILRDICVECPSFSKIPEICVKMIRRVNDEDGIRKLVMEVFQNMWFTPVREEPLDREALLRKVSHITDVVASCEKVALDFFEQLLLSLFKPKDDRDDVREKVVNLEPPKTVVTAASQIVNCLVEHVLRIEESSTMDETQTQRFIACVGTLLLFAKIRPQLLINHAITLEGYLSMRTQTPMEIAAVANIANILELVVPLLVNPSESFLIQLEEDCIKLIFRPEKAVIDACLACLGAVLNKITRNYDLIRDLFRKFQKLLSSHVIPIRLNPVDPHASKIPGIRRIVYTIGIFLRYFDFTNPALHGELGPEVVPNVFRDLVFLLSIPAVQLFSLQAIGSVCIRHYDFMLGNELKFLYQQFLVSTTEIQLRVQTLLNLQLYLVEEELRMIKQDQEWIKNPKHHDIKEMGDVTSGMASTIVQIYLKQILESFLHAEPQVRLAVVRVVQLILQQGLVHPIQIVPYLVCMSTDDEQGVGATADKQLQEMEKKHPQFLQSQLLTGIRLSLHLQRILKGYRGSILPIGLQTQLHGSEIRPIEDGEEHGLPIVRGYRVKPKEPPSAHNGFLYSLLRSTKPQRRAMALLLLKQFDEQSKIRLADLLYYADVLAYFPYQVVDEPLFIIHHIDIVISVTGSNLLQGFKEALIPIHPPPQVTPVKPQSEAVLNPETGFLDGTDEDGAQTEQAVQSMEVVPNKVDIMDDDDENVDSLLSRFPNNLKPLEEFISGSQGCLLLLMLKQHLKDMYGLTEARISGYSPSDATKLFERPVNRKNVPQFDPKCTIANMSRPPCGDTEESRRSMVEQYLHFKQLMLRIDPEDGEEDGEVKQVKIKIDQNLFTYPSAKVPQPTPQQQQPSQHHGRGNKDTPSTSLNHSPVKNSHDHHRHEHGHAPSYYATVSHQSQPTGTPVAKVEPMVRVPKLTIVPLKFPGSGGNESGDVRKQQHKIKNKEHHHHHHKHKKSKHKKKKRYAVSDDEDSDNPDSDPDFHI